jgi:hypothetical protein
LAQALQHSASEMMVQQLLQLLPPLLQVGNWLQ